MSDNARDTRPAWMLDPTMTEIDEDAIAAVGQELENQVADAMNNPFFNRGIDPADNEGQGSQSPASASTPSLDAPPTADGAPPTTAPTSGGSDAPQGAAPPETPNESGQSAQGISLDLPDGTKVDLNRDQVFALMQNYEWMRSRPQQVLEAWAGIEQGTHNAVPQTEYAQFQAWKAQQGLSQRVGQRPVDLDDVDPDVAQYIARLEQAASQGTPPPDTPPNVGQGQMGQQVVQSGQGQLPVTALDLAAQQQAQVTRQIRLMQAKNEVHAELMQRYGMTQDQVNALEAEVAAAQIVPAISMRHAVKNAMGQIIQEGDPKAVFTEAFEATMATHPTFRSIRDDAVYQQRLQQERQRNASTDAKKAAAGSLAHTPSAAVSATGTGNKTPAQMTPQELQAAMVAELTQLIASGEAFN